MLRVILRAFSKENLPHKSLSTAVATLILISSGVGLSDYKTKEEMLAALITAAVSVILFFVDDSKRAKDCPPCEAPQKDDGSE